MKPVYFYAMADTVVVGTNPENADMTNPRGEIIGFAGWVVAQSYEGERRRLYVATDLDCKAVLEKAEKVAKALNARLTNLGKIPVGFDRWESYHAAYGSDLHDEEELIAWERRMEEEQEWR